MAPSNRPPRPLNLQPNRNPSRESIRHFSDPESMDHESSRNLLGGNPELTPKWSRRQTKSGWRRNCLPRLRILGILIGVASGILCVYTAIMILIHTSTTRWQREISNSIDNWKGSPGEWYPTSFSRDIIPKHIHSHNDYWREVPLYTGISYGAISTEADVFLIEDELYVGHTRASLTVNRTLSSLYIDPILKILEFQNPSTLFSSNDTLNGVFDTDPSQTLYLYIDVKTDPIPTYNKINANLQKLRSPKNYLTTYENGKITYRPITVILTGDAPFATMTANKNYRYTFYDAPINELKSGKYDKTTSITATGNFKSLVGGGGIPFLQGGSLSEKEKARLKEQVDEAHKLGLIVRYWNLPGWPVSWRNAIWREVVKAGVDLLSVDDLRAAARDVW